MSEDESVARLRALGLNLYESRAYLALLRGGRLTAKGVGQSAIIPQSRTYDVLQSLTRKGLAVATAGSPSSYIPVPPKEVLKQRYESERRRTQEVAVRVQEEAQAKLESIHDAYESLTKEFPGRPNEALPVQDRVWVIQGRDNIEDTLGGMIKEAKQEVLRITRPPEPKRSELVDPFYILGPENQRHIFEALRRKVSMRWLSLKGEIPTILGLEVEEPPNRRYLSDEEDITEKFIATDSQSVLLNLRDASTPDYGYVAIAMHSRQVSSIFLEHFEKMWEKGRPLADVLPRARQEVEDICVKLAEVGLPKAGVLLYRTLATRGAITQDVLTSHLVRKKVRAQEAESACNTLIRLGLVNKVSYLQLLIIEHPAKVRASLRGLSSKIEKAPGFTTGNSRSGKNL